MLGNVAHRENEIQRTVKFLIRPCFIYSLENYFSNHNFCRVIKIFDDEHLGHVKSYVCGLKFCFYHREVWIRSVSLVGLVKFLYNVHNVLLFIRILSTYNKFLIGKSMVKCFKKQMNSKCPQLLSVSIYE